MDSLLNILDMRMPGLSGLDLLKKLSSRSIKPSVIALSAYDDAQMGEKAKEYGALVFVTKPVDDQAFIDTIHSEVAGKRQNR